MMESRQQAEIIVRQIIRKCVNCTFTLNALSTRCGACGTENPFQKVNETNYYEHFEVKECTYHKSCLHWCQHPKVDSTLDDLISDCALCCQVLLDAMCEVKKEETQGHEPDAS